MTGVIHKTLAFLRRDFFIATSYKFQFLFQLASGLFIVATFYFVSRMIGPGVASAFLKPYKTDYFSFIIVGLAASGFLFTGLAGLSERVRTAMTEGSLEMMFASPTRPVLILVMPCLWSFVFETLRAYVVIVLAVFLFGFDVTRTNFLSLTVVAVLTVLAYSAFGIVAAALIIIFKRGDPINWAFAHASTLLGGAYFPVEMLPAWILPVTKVLPMTYAYRGLRMTMLARAGLPEVLPEVAVLAVFAAIGLPLALVALNLAVRQAKRDGSLGSF